MPTQHESFQVCKEIIKQEHVELKEKVRHQDRFPPIEYNSLKNLRAQLVHLNWSTTMWLQFALFTGHQSDNNKILQFLYRYKFLEQPGNTSYYLDWRNHQLQWKECDEYVNQVNWCRTIALNCSQGLNRFVRFRSRATNRATPVKIASHINEESAHNKHQKFEIMFLTVDKLLD